TGIRISAIRYHHGLSRLPIASPAETGGMCPKCLTGPTYRRAERRPIQMRSPCQFPTSANTDDPGRKGAAWVMGRTSETLVSRLFRDAAVDLADRNHGIASAHAICPSKPRDFAM